MRREMCFAAAVGLGLIAAVPVSAQEPKKEVQGYVAGGYAMPEGVASDYLNGGWNISGGAIYRPSPGGRFGIRFDLG